MQSSETHGIEALKSRHRRKRGEDIRKGQFAGATNYRNKTSESKIILQMNTDKTIKGLGGFRSKRHQKISLQNTAERKFFENFDN